MTCLFSSSSRSGFRHHVRMIRTQSVDLGKWISNPVHVLLSLSLLLNSCLPKHSIHCSPLLPYLMDMQSLERDSTQLKKSCPASSSLLSPAAIPAAMPVAYISRCCCCNKSISLIQVMRSGLRSNFSATYSRNRRTFVRSFPLLVSQINWLTFSPNLHNMQ